MEPRNEFLSDILITATEGSINYWAGIKLRRWQGKPAEVDSVLLYVSLYDIEEAGTTYYTVDHESLEKALALVLSPEFQVRDDIRQYIYMGNLKNDAGEIDADAADVLIQAAVFGEIVYS